MHDEHLSPQAFVDFFFDDPFVRFSLMTVVKGQHWRTWAISEEERVFKAYYVFLLRNAGPFSRYNVYVDQRSLQKPYRWASLHFLVNRARRNEWNLRRRNLKVLEPVDSKASLLLQLADLMLGALTSGAQSVSKVELQQHVTTRRAEAPAKKLRIETWTPRPSGQSRRTRRSSRPPDIARHRGCAIVPGGGSTPTSRPTGAIVEGTKIEDKDLYRVALDTKNLEITLFRQRCNYFLVLNSALALGFFNLKEAEYSVLLAVVGLITLVLWLAVSLGSKFWQARWEHRLSLIEKQLAPGLDFFSADRATVKRDVEESLKSSEHWWFQRSWIGWFS